MKKFSAGLVALVIKISPKIFSVLGKVLKGLKVGKVGLAAGSMASYAYLTTWQFAALIMLLLFVHENGHIWAMKKCGMKTKGVYYLPLLGAAAVSESEFPSRQSEVFVAIMGPIWGFGLAAFAGLIYLAFDSPFFAAVAGWMALVNLFNLMPISPLDGGRILKSIAFSVDSRLGLLFLSLGIIASGYLAVIIGMSLFVFLLFIATLELIFEYGERHKRTPMGRRDILLSFIIYAAVALGLWQFMATMSHEPGAEIAMEFLRG